MIGILYQVIRTSRPRQWIKNLSLFAVPIFFGNFFRANVFLNTTKAFFVFCAMSSAAYFINDIIDADKDKLHPVKKNRPIASGKLSKSFSWILSIILIISSVLYSLFFIGNFFTYALVFYILLQLSYSLYLKNVIILDSLTIATLFVVRVFSGGFASDTSVSSWLMLTTIGLSLLLAFGKRRSEKSLVQQYIGTDNLGNTRKTLRHYPDNLLDSMISMSAAYATISYSFFVFQLSPEVIGRPLIPYLPSIISNPKWMMLSIPLVIYGVARYLYVIYEKKEGESPERVLLSDIPLLLTTTLWISYVFVVIYLLPNIN